MSPRSSKRTVSAEPTPDIYTGLLFVSVASLITGCIFLALELSRYEWTIPG
jgi:hypothetical protein